mgnify:CR=1 FL=1
MKNNTSSDVLSVINAGEKILENSQIQSARNEAEQIVSYFMKMTKTALYLNMNQLIPDATQKNIDEAFRKRAKRYPLQYILQEVHFLNTILKVDESVLIARPETEFLCDFIIREYQKKDIRQIRCLDMGTGSGAIAISLKKELKMISMEAVDISDRALRTAKKNAEFNQTQIHFIQSDLFENVQGKYDLIISNPPYVTEAEYSQLEPELFFEPKNALVSENNGLNHIFKIIASAIDYMNPNAVLYLEIGAKQAETIISVTKNYRYRTVQIIKDLSGFDRFIRLEL